MNKNVITLAIGRIVKSCSKNWEEVYEYAGAQDINDKQYKYVSERAQRYCKITERNAPVFGWHLGYKLYPTTAFVFQLLAEFIAGYKTDNVIALLPEFWNSKYVAVILLFLGEAAIEIRYVNPDLLSGMSFDIMEMMGNGHAPATYYILTHHHKGGGFR